MAEFHCQYDQNDQILYKINQFFEKKAYEAGKSDGEWMLFEYARFF